MIPKHHALTMEAATDLIDYWSTPPTPQLPPWLPVAAMQALVQRAGVKRMTGWVAQIDDLNDVNVSGLLAKLLVELYGNVTSLQHFSYSGYMGEELRSGTSVVKKYDGYCWDCDPYLRWYEQLANIHWRNAKYNTNCGVFDAALMEESPGAKEILGDTDWDDQLYPSALELAEFYGHIPGRDKDWDIQGLCFCIHMLQDLAVPHHVLCTLENGHRRFEEDMYDFWRFIYSGRSNDKRGDVIRHQLSKEVLSLLMDPSLQQAGSFNDIGIWAVDNTRKWLETSCGISRCAHKIDARNRTVQGMACTIRAIALHIRNTSTGGENSKAVAETDTTKKRGSRKREKKT